MLGLATAVGVAWLIAAFRPVPAYPRTVLGAFERWGLAWNISESTRLGTVDVWWLDLRSGEPGAEHRPAAELIAAARAGHAETAASRDGVILRDSPRPWGTFAADKPPDEARIGSDTAYGWPWPCLWYRTTAEFQGPTTIGNERLHGGMFLHGTLSARLRDFRALPYWPIWAGLAADAAVWGTMWLALLTLPRVARRWHRRRRGRCAECGYDLCGVTSGVCPECGGGGQR